MSTFLATFDQGLGGAERVTADEDRSAPEVPSDWSHERKFSDHTYFDYCTALSDTKTPVPSDRRNDDSDTGATRDHVLIIQSGSAIQPPTAIQLPSTIQSGPTIQSTHS